MPPLDPPALHLVQLLDRVAAGAATLCVLGIGNELLGDDGIGTCLARQLQEADLPGLCAIPAGIAPENAYGLVSASGASILLLVDAVAREDMAPGAWDFFDPDALDAAIHSTHSVPLSLFVRLWRGDIPGLDVQFLGINLGAAPAPGPPSAALETTRQELLTLFHRHLRGNPGP